MSVNIKKDGELLKQAGNASASRFISDKYSPTKSYDVGDYCIYNDLLWKKIGATEVGVTPTNGTSWTQTKVDSELGNFGGLRFGIDADGNYGYFKVGADSVTPFKNFSNATLLDDVLLYNNATKKYTLDKTKTYLVAACMLFTTTTKRATIYIVENNQLKEIVKASNGNATVTLSNGTLTIKGTSSSLQTEFTITKLD
ncbi:MAG: hypothetical protein MJ236_00855 [Clostridia bacterium]|nr:hypothetical protein [Clostridia bacterium]